MAMRLEAENVRIILTGMLSVLEYRREQGTDAEKKLAYIAGMIDMANAVIEEIEELGGN